MPPSASIRSLSPSRPEPEQRHRDRAPGDLGRRDGVALRDLGVAVGLRQPSLYVYFASKLDLYDAMFADGHRQLLELWRSGGTARTASGAVHVCRRPRAVRWVRDAEQLLEPRLTCAHLPERAMAETHPALRPASRPVSLRTTRWCRPRSVTSSGVVAITGHAQQLAASSVAATAGLPPVGVPLHQRRRGRRPSAESRRCPALPLTAPARSISFPEAGPADRCIKRDWPHHDAASLPRVY